jgi:hypothetical protein
VPINPYFSFNSFNNRNEQSLVQNLLEESIRIFGMDIYYIPRTFVELDTLFGESQLNVFSKYYTVEMYFDNPTGYGGDKTFISKFIGLAIAPSAFFLVSKRRFDTILKNQGPYNIPPTEQTIQDVRPLEGDLIYVPMTKDFWEIKFVDHEVPFFMMGQVNIWKLSVEKYVYTSERISTGNTEIDRLQTTHSHDGNIPALDRLADNEEIETESDLTIDFSETDPFSEGEYH